jgi:membrane-associated phospholipid phosphatase
MPDPSGLEPPHIPEVSRDYVLWGLLGLAGVVLVALSVLDVEWTLWLHEHRDPVFGEWMRRTLFEGDLPGGSDPAIVFLLVALALYLVAGRRAVPEGLKVWRPMLTFVILAALAGALGQVHGLKWVIGRARPYEVWSGDWPYTAWFEFGPHFVTEGIYYGSFPSGHTAAVLALLIPAYLLWFHPQPRWSHRLSAVVLGLLVLGGAIAMGTARVMTAHHWLSDGLGIIFPTWALLHWIHHHLLKVSQQRFYVLFNGIYPSSVPAYWELRFAGWCFLLLLGVMAIFLGMRSIAFQDPPILLGMTPVGGLFSAWAFTRARDLYVRVMSEFFEPVP